MLDQIALMQFLTLPPGAVTGARIELGVTPGVIQVFNSSGELVGEIDPTGVISVFDPVAGSKVVISPTNPAAIEFTPKTPFGAHTLGDASIKTDEVTVPDRARLVLLSPSLDGGDRGQITLESDTGSGAGVFVLDTGGSDNARFQVFGQATINTTLNALDDVQRNGVSLPRGALSFGQLLNAGPFDLSATAGTYTAIVGNAVDIPVQAGQSYRVSYWNEGPNGLLVAGSGLTTSTSWTGKFQRSTNGGSTWSDISQETEIARLEVAAATRKPVPYISTIYQPTGSANVRWQFLMAKFAGASTVTSTLDDDHFILIEHLGSGI